jgi:chromosome segregation ATPase
MSVWDRMQRLLGQGFHTSRELLARAKDKAQELGEIGLLKHELSRLEKQAQNLFGRLGLAAFDRLAVRGQASVSREEVRELVAELAAINEKIEQKQADLEAMRSMRPGGAAGF